MLWNTRRKADEEEEVHCEGYYQMAKQNSYEKSLTREAVWGVLGICPAHSQVAVFERTEHPQHLL